MSTLAEQMVVSLQRQREAEDKYDTWMRSLRMGATVEAEETVRVKRLFLTRNACRVVEFSPELASTFYRFLEDMQRSTRDAITKVEADLAELR